MNLVRAELERLAARRFVQLMVVLLAAAFAVTVVTTLGGSHRPTGAELGRAQAQAAEEVRRLELAHDRCLRIKAGTLTADENDYLPRDCAQIDPAQSDTLPTASDYLSGVFVFAKEAEPLLFFLIAFLALFGFLVGASYIGADLNSGGVVNLLLWRPRRPTVLAAKLGTLLGGLLALSVLASVAYLGSFWLIGQASGLTGRTGGDFWVTLGAIWARGLVLVLATAALGFAVATLGRHTSAALGTVAAYVVVWELGARLVFQILEVGRPDRFMLSSYLAAWLNGEVRFWDGNACSTGISGFCDGSYTLTWVSGMVVLLGLTAALVAAAFTVFRRRDLI
ncbi:ABC-type transport system involved in multi-copper enzyme maturation, permease component [Micromonospora sediminicola]|uniref:ABC-type transport system involved in multi-copper enzyme maturation, permease component n=1 Tax=Micromonospora sediminicola TaxID=946078 RepID=A0A1A9BFV1_9ACTN|nr:MULTISPECIES: ABC transporter permease subunit [Micromonospora]PGH43128.1 ABC transporter permease [Micromonospora sp. WMMA1996]SBT68375.1 ABC-type transport system involved in multi-copper enzyme maturation, permease component [Micromonospora sediminicola]